MNTNYNTPVDIYIDEESDQVDEAGDKITVPKKLATVFARVEDRTGGLLTGRSANSILSTVTHKFSWHYYNFPEVIPRKHYLMFENKQYNIDYADDFELRHEELQVFATVKL